MTETPRAPVPRLTVLLQRLGQNWQKHKRRYDRAYASGKLLGEKSADANEAAERLDESYFGHSFPGVLDWVQVRTGLAADDTRRAALCGFRNCAEMVTTLKELDGSQDVLALWQKLLVEHGEVLRESQLIPTGTDPAESLEGDGKPKGKAQGTGKPKSKRGRPRDTDATTDQRIADAWATKRYATYQELADELGRKRREVVSALDRHRKRQQGRRNKSPRKPRQAE